MILQLFSRNKTKLDTQPLNLSTETAAFSPIYSSISRFVKQMNYEFYQLSMIFNEFLAVSCISIKKTLSKTLYFHPRQTLKEMLFIPLSGVSSLKSDPGRAKVCYRGGFAGFNGGGPIKIGGQDLDDFYVHLKSSVIQIRVSRKKSRSPNGES